MNYSRLTQLNLVAINFNEVLKTNLEELWQKQILNIVDQFVSQGWVVLN